MDWIVLINNDTWVEPDFIARLRPILSPSADSTSSLRADSEQAIQEGVVGLPLQEGDRTAYCGQIRWLKPTLLHIYDRRILTNLARTEFINTYAIGAGVAIHRSVFENIGYLDERYFLYFEDADFSLRAQCEGAPFTFLGEPVVHHEVSSTTKSLGTPLLLRYHWRNAHLFNWNNGPLWVKVTLPFWSFFTIIKQLLKLVININPDKSRAILAGVIDFYLKRFGKIG